MAYYTSETCGYVSGSWIVSGCTTSYDSSDIKYVVDGWTQAKFTDELKTVDGYSSRLITHDELVTNLGCARYHCNNSPYSWVHDTSYVYYWYWTMSQYNDSASYVWIVEADGRFNYDYGVYAYDPVVRPVINVYKSAIQSN